MRLGLKAMKPQAYSPAVENGAYCPDIGLGQRCLWGSALPGEGGLFDRVGEKP
jgi:hypothetical protein